MMKKRNKTVTSWGMEKDVQIPTRIFASDDDLSSDGKLILCSRKKKDTNDVEFIGKEWLMDMLEELLADKPDILKSILAKIDANPQ